MDVLGLLTGKFYCLFVIHALEIDVRGSKSVHCIESFFLFWLVNYERLPEDFESMSALGVLDPMKS
jgi:hypothetical protein